MNNKIVIIIICIFIILFSGLGYKFYQNRQEINHLQEEMKALEEEIAEAEAENEQLQSRLNNLDDPEYIERIARKKLGLVKPGEVLLIPVEENNNKENGE